MPHPITRPIPWLTPEQPFPDSALAWGAQDPAPGLLAAGGCLSVNTLRQAYRHGVFPWFSADQPILWWSPDPRMVLEPPRFRLHRSMRKTLKAFLQRPGAQLRFDHDFSAVIRACAGIDRQRERQSSLFDAARAGHQAGAHDTAPTSTTWIVPDMVAAYERLHRAGHDHSVETWVDGQLVGGLYCVVAGRAVFGESMFSRRTDASKIALAALVAYCLVHGIPMIDCQQDTRHLASLGASVVPRARFSALLTGVVDQAPAPWIFEPVYWNTLMALPERERAQPLDIAHPGVSG